MKLLSGEFFKFKRTVDTEFTPVFSEETNNAKTNNNHSSTYQ